MNKTHVNDHGEKEYTYFWFIENYSYCWHKNGEGLLSPVFKTDKFKGIFWRICLYPRGQDDEDTGKIGICLRRIGNRAPPLFKVNYSLSIVADEGPTSFTTTHSSIFRKSNQWGWPFVEIEEILSLQKAKYLPKDILTVCCKLWKGNGCTEKVTPICARTRIGIEHISFLHVVERFSALEPNKTLWSKAPSKEDDGISCTVCISDNSCDGKVMVEIMPSNSGQILGTCEISVLDVSGEKIKCASSDNRCDAMRKDIGKLSLSLTRNAIINRKREWLPEDKLSLLCECTFSVGIEFQRIEETQNEITLMSKNLKENNSCFNDDSISTEKLVTCPGVAEDLKVIYDNKFLTDVALKTKGNSFPAHKIVLCARSPVFKVMMSSDMKEKNSDIIQVDDLEDDTVQQLLVFLYSDDIEDLSYETATKLYYAADKYQVEKLSMICSSFLISNITISTAPELLLLADTHCDYLFKNHVEDFILEHDEQVFRSEKWKKFMETNPLLAVKTMHLKYNTEVGN